MAMISKYPTIPSGLLLSQNIECILCLFNSWKLATQYRMSFIQALVLFHVILNINWTTKGYSQLEILAPVSNGAGAGEFGSDSIDEEIVESKGMFFKNVDVWHSNKTYRNIIHIYS